MRGYRWTRSSSGGTPTHLSVLQLQQLAELIAGHFELQPGGEYSMEANPDGLEAEKLRVLHEAGVNRLSLGVQSFDDDVLRLLERTHRADAAAEVVCEAASILPAVSLDLMFGVPGQSEASWQRTLERAVSLPVVHVSTYGLTWEQGTPFFVGSAVVSCSGWRRSWSGVSICKRFSS